ncbi:hypothetical protein [Actinomadura rupiterrae]|uniref:hypothetical protein n=1 Tax=Actinomadura rupiterrae TaxID=559627 RepID=UPI0020A41D46|nr:hypothetical protein [Actinomadura rupiterrae]MCP2337492.1 hypothetical protein [Actinomadura rupiterrae]
MSSKLRLGYALLSALVVSAASCSAQSDDTSHGPPTPSPSGGAPDWALIGASPPPRAPTDKEGLATELPDVFNLAIGSIPADIKSGQPGRDVTDFRNNQSYYWVSVGAKNIRILRISVRREKSIAAAKSWILGQRKGLSGNPGPASGEGAAETGRAENLTGLGDEAFTFWMKQNDLPQGTGSARSKYNVGGAFICARQKNVWISITLEGADGLQGAASGRSISGTPLPFAPSRDQEVSIARSIFSGMR